MASQILLSATSRIFQLVEIRPYPKFGRRCRSEQMQMDSETDSFMSTFTGLRIVRKAVRQLIGEWKYKSSAKSFDSPELSNMYLCLTNQESGGTETTPGWRMTVRAD